MSLCLTRTGKLGLPNSRNRLTEIVTESGLDSVMFRSEKVANKNANLWTILFQQYLFMEVPKRPDGKKSKVDEQTLAEFNSGHRRSPLGQLVQTSYILNCSCLPHNKHLINRA